MAATKPLYFASRREWREWLAANFTSADEVWFVFPHKGSGRPAVLYNDAVEEALCFGWIDSTVRSLDPSNKIQRFTPRRPRSPYSQSNRERLRWLMERGLVHPAVEAGVREVLSEPFVFPADIVARLQADAVVWENFGRFSDAYRRIRVAYVEAARMSAPEFEKRLRNLIDRTRRGEQVPGYGGIEKYY